VRREFGYRKSLRAYVGICVAVVVYPGLMVWAKIGTRGTYGATVSAVCWGSVGVIGLLAGVAIAERYLWATRGWVRLDDDGIAACGAFGPAARLRWEAINEIAFWTGSGENPKGGKPGKVGYMGCVIRGDESRIRISHHVDTPRELMAALWDTGWFVETGHSGAWWIWERRSRQRTANHAQPAERSPQTRPAVAPARRAAAVASQTFPYAQSWPAWIAACGVAVGVTITALAVGEAHLTKSGHGVLAKIGPASLAFTGAALGAWSWMRYVWTRDAWLRVDDTGVTAQHPLRGEIALPWDEVREIEFVGRDAANWSDPEMGAFTSCTIRGWNQDIKAPGSIENAAVLRQTLWRTGLFDVDAHRTTRRGMVWRKVGG
jgi:hypothetical protein